MLVNARSKFWMILRFALISSLAFSYSGDLLAAGKKRKKKKKKSEKKLIERVNESGEFAPPPNNAPLFSELGFQMGTVADWKIEAAEGLDNIAFINEVKSSDPEYKAKMQITRLDGQIYLSPEVIEEFKVKIQETMEKTGYINGFEFRNQETTTLSDGTEAALYYSAMTIRKVKAMQAHLLIPAEQHYYLLSYTDKADYIEGEKSEKYYEKIWPAMFSFVPFEKQLPQKTFWEKWKIWILLAGLIFITGGLLTYLNRYVPENDFDAILDNDFGDDEAYVSSQMELDQILAQKAKKYKTKKSDPFEKLENAVGMGSLDYLAEDDIDSSDFLEDDEDELIAI